jgi:hypothetical protein
MPKRVSHASGKKSNGHKNSCRCPICMNMMKKKGGAKDDDEKDDEKDDVKDEFVEGFAEELFTGGKKSNGHKKLCRCPICMNMKKKGGSEDDDEKDDVKDDEKFEPGEIEEEVITGGKKSNGHKKLCRCPICMNMKKKGGKNGEPEPEPESEPNITGGKRRKSSTKRRKSRRNRTRRRTHRR